MKLTDDESYPEIVREVAADLGGECIIAVPAMPQHLIYMTEALSRTNTEVTIHLWEDGARVVIYRGWIADAPPAGEITYDARFAANLRDLIERLEASLVGTVASSEQLSPVRLAD
jgi:hypothetical protein